jgi:4-amino-4-deoxy-L-arabinose transferase-like glycosyltransferase
MNRILNSFGKLGILICAGISVYISANVFFQSVGPFIHQPDDYSWAFFFLAVVILISITFWINRGRFLLFFIISVLVTIIILPAIFANLWGVFLALFLILLAAAEIGLLIFKWVAPKLNVTFAEKFILAVVLGLGALMVLGLIMGIAGLYIPVAAYFSLGLLIAIGLPNMLFELRQNATFFRTSLYELFKQKDLRLASLGLGFFFICFLGAYLWSLAPAIRWDSLSYHLAVPEIFIRNKAMIEIPESYNTYWAQYAEMLYTYAMLLVGQPLPGLLHLVSGILTALLIFLFGKRVMGPRVGLIGAVLFFSMPLVSFESGSTYIDLFVAMFVMAALFSGLLWWLTNQKEWLLVAGIFSGLAFGTKLSAFVFILPLVCLIIIGLVIRRSSLKGTILCLSSFGLPALVLYLPWAVRDFIWLGNPIFPYFSHLFPGSRAVLEIADWDLPVQNQSFLIKMITLPWNLVVNSQQFYHEAPAGIVGAVPLLALPWFYWRQLIDREQRCRILPIVIYGVSSFSLFFIVNNNARYLIPGFSAIVLLAAINLGNIKGIHEIRNKYWRTVIIGSLILVAGAIVLTGRLAEVIRITYFPERYPLKVDLGMETRDTFLSRTLPVYDIFSTLNLQPGQHKVLSLGMEYRLYTKSQIFGLYFSPVIRQKVQAAKNEDELAQVLQQQGFDYIFLAPAEQRLSPKEYEVKALTSDFYHRYTKIVATNQNLRLYRFISTGIEPNQFSPNLLLNSSFEEQGVPSAISGWNIVIGIPWVEADSAAHEGKYIVHVFGPAAPEGYAYINQEVPVQPGKIYIAGYWFRGSIQSSLQLQVEWLDSNHQTIKTDLDWAGLNNNWEFANMALNSPPQAAYAKVYASVTGNGTAVLDDLCFAEGDRCQ